MLYSMVPGHWLGLLIGLVLFSGCRFPWQRPNDVPTIAARTQTTRDGPSARISDQPDALAAPNASGSQAIASSVAHGQSGIGTSEELAMAAVFDELQAIRDLDPEAHQILMQDLQAAKPAHWPLIVHHFHAALTYRQQRLEQDQAPQATALDADPPIGADHNLNSATASTATAIGDYSTGRAEAAADPGLSTGSELIRTREKLSQSTQSAAVQPTAPNSPLESQAVRTASFQHQPNRARLPDPFDRTTAEPELQIPNGPIPTAPSWQAQLHATIEQLEAVTHDIPSTAEDIHQQVMLRMLYLVASRRDDALQPIPGISPAQQDFWAQQLFALATYLDDQKQPDPQRRATLARTYLTEATALLGELGTLSIRNLTFCENVSGFGVYSAIEQPKYVPEAKVLLYAEIENYRSDATEEGYRTVLNPSYEVLDDRGQRIDSGSFPQIEDLCKTRRRDFHTQYVIDLPKRIYPGKYHLQLIVQDLLSNKIGRTSTEFEIKEGQ